MTRERNDAVRNVMNAAQRNQLVFFVGAGISGLGPTSIPLADCVKVAVVASLVERCIEDSRFSWVRELSPSAFGHLPLEVVLDNIHAVVGARATAVFEICRDRPTNAIHHTLIRFMDVFGTNIVTTNQDEVLELAAREMDVRLNAIVSKADVAQARAEPHRVLLKLHGTVSKPRSIVATLRRATKGLSGFKHESMKHLLRGKFVCFIGWSGRDLDIAPLLSDLVDKGLWILRPTVRSAVSSSGPSDERTVALASQLGLRTIRYDIQQVMQRLSVALPQRDRAPSLVAKPSSNLDEVCRLWARSLSIYQSAEALSLLTSYTAHSSLVTQAAGSIVVAAPSFGRVEPTKARYRFALACARSGDYETATKHANRARLEARKKGARRLEADCVGLLGTVSRRLGRHPLAKRRLRLAAKLAMQAGDKVGWAYWTERLGTVFADEKDYRKALELRQQALPVIRRAGLTDRLIGIKTNIGLCLVELGHVEDGMELLNEARDLADATGDKLHGAVALYNLGHFTAKLLGEQKMAIGLIRQAHETFRAAGDATWTVTTGWRLADILTDNKNYQEAIPLFRSVRGVAKRSKNYRAVTEIDRRVRAVQRLAKS